MSTREERIKVFQDTVDWIQSDPALAAAVEEAKMNTTVYYEDDYPVFDAGKNRKTVVNVTPEKSFEAAMRLHKENPQARIAVLNFANAFHPGGGVKKGSSAQEESLCRTSTLYPLLDRKKMRESFYRHHYELNTPRASDSLIYIEGVVICKTDDDLPVRLPQEEWVTVDVITQAAPDLRESSNPRVKFADGMQEAELLGYHIKRAIHLLTCAAAKGADILVLGAFGCGAFKNSPAIVSKAYAIALHEFPKVFEKVTFAVYCAPGNTDNYNVFDWVLDRS